MALWTFIASVIGTHELFLAFECLLRSLIYADTPVQVDFEEVQEGVENGSLIYLDVRDRFQVLTDGRVGGSLVVPLGEIESAFSCDDHEFLAHYGFLKPSKSSSSVVVASRNGRRAAVAIEKFKKIGYNSFKIYKGSFVDWKARGGLVVKE